MEKGQQTRTHIFILSSIFNFQLIRNLHILKNLLSLVIYIFSAHAVWSGNYGKPTTITIVLLTNYNIVHVQHAGVSGELSDSTISLPLPLWHVGVS